MIVVIPCYNEPGIEKVLYGLEKCVPPPCHVEVIVVINQPEGADHLVIEQNKVSRTQIRQYSIKSKNSSITVHALNAGSLPKKSAGVGLARKIGMDEAVWRFESINKKNGLIISLDADCSCDANYLTEIYSLSKKKDGFTGGVVYFEHPFPLNDPKLREWIIDYELHIRYYVDALRMIGYPYAFHTIGSTMITTSEAYQKQGGMNQKKAGEDFYFLHKIIPLGGFYRINTTTVYPGVRFSDRVPFGTGKALNNMNAKGERSFKTFHPQSFGDLKTLFAWIRAFNSTTTPLSQYRHVLPEPTVEYLTKINFEENLLRIQRHTNTPSSFTKTFFHWFNALKILQFMHFCRDKYYKNHPIEMAAHWLCEHHLKIDPTGKTKEELLILIREWDRNND